MASEKIVLTMEESLVQKIKMKSQQQGFSTVQKYIYDLLHHAVYTKKHAGGRLRRKDPETEYLDKFSQPTKETYKIERSVGLL